jgi:hypothetical protein
MQPNMNREEFLFWRHVDALVAGSENAEVSGFSNNPTKNSKTPYVGLAFSSLDNNTYFSPLLRLNYYISSKGFQVCITTDYSGCSNKTQEEFDRQIPEFSTLYEKTFTWEGFVFDELINWIVENRNWDLSRFKSN